ncbi:hypothetical protein CW751_04865 [Brumimicrobium salinarum]|uniref:PKD domain-containing protein n=1 Tax=Brumimicrobium salinarum TaxID=2058658 RepID=A0A2I0R485_9FLAO|nr:gliding motility-associated C-terminal domain-containing protein [Brumimicrobium salinarum]PKR81391.1 hypothetical protein CW751_04865 [Brumimicrobium salinarum]
MIIAKNLYNVILSLKNTNLGRCFVGLLFFLFSFDSLGQIIFEENFNQPDGTTSGVANGVNWSSTCPTCLSGDHWEVKSGVFEGKDTNGEAIWITDDEIDISTCSNIEISFDIESVGPMEGCGDGCNAVDWVSLHYSIDGASWLAPNNANYCAGPCAEIDVVASGDSPLTNYSTGCIPAGGNGLKIKIMAQCWAGNEHWQIDNIKVSCGGESAGLDGEAYFCPSSTTMNLFDYLGGSPVSTGSWTGPSALLGGSLGTFDSSSMLPGVYTYTVGSAPCEETATVTVNDISFFDAGTDETMEICADQSPIDLFNVLGENPSPVGVWSGPSNLTNGHLGTFDPQFMVSGIYEYTIGTPPCTISSFVEVVNTQTGNPGASSSIELCKSDAYLYLFESLNGAPDSSGVWTGPSSLGSGFQGGFNPQNMEGGIYTYTVGNGFCVDSAQVSVTVNGPIADFTATPTNTTIENTTVIFTNESQNASNYEWDFGTNSSVYTHIHPHYNFPDQEPGTYTVVLTATDENGCSDNSTQVIVITAPEMDYTVPNVFTPNTDSDNDVFQLIDPVNIKEIEVIILNRWGSTVFKSDSVDFKWNGSINNSGLDCTTGVYFYTLKIKGKSGEKEVKHGYVHLHR